jgi:hypothetical protein
MEKNGNNFGVLELSSTTLVLNYLLGADFYRYFTINQDFCHITGKRDTGTMWGFFDGGDIRIIARLRSYAKCNRAGKRTASRGTTADDDGSVAELVCLQFGVRRFAVRRLPLSAFDI